MTDDFAEGWIEFEAFLSELKESRKLSERDIEEYFKMWKDHQESES